MNRLKNNRRSGKVLVFIGIMLIVIFSMAALAIDTGWVMVTRTQLHAAADSGSLAGGTELIFGLGVGAFRTPAEVRTRAELQAIEFVAKHRAGDADAAHIEAARDVQMGTAAMNPATGEWTFVWGAVPYNAVGVTTHRSDVGSSDGDKPLPLFLAPVIGHDTANVSRFAVAVILPANGIRIPPGSGIKSGLSPFAFEQARWDKYFRARKYFEENDLTASDLDEVNNGDQILDPINDGSQLFYEQVPIGTSGNFNQRQMFDDRFKVVNPELDTPANILAVEDGVLEANIYPINSESGNFGTVDIGGLDNSTAEIKRQILEGVSEQDMEDYEDNMIDPSEGAPVQLQGDTGISAGIQAALEEIVGQCRAIVLYSNVQNPGNNASYTIVDIVGIRVMHVNLAGKNKLLVIQPCSVSDPAAVPDYEEEIGEDTSFFSPLILAR